MATATEQPPWLTYLEWDVLGSVIANDARVYEVVLKVRAENILAIIKARKDEQSFVAFVGGRSLASLSRGIRETIRGGPEKWRTDRYAKT